ncbi:MAG: hypothetical protein GX051_01405 [Clostridiales bacterium]|nr:hypothetical protein [Clostridiales bacterium]
MIGFWVWLILGFAVRFFYSSILSPLRGLSLRNMVALLAWSASQFSLFLHSRTSLLPPPASITRRTAKRLL